MTCLCGDYECPSCNLARFQRWGVIISSWTVDGDRTPGELMDEIDEWLCGLTDEAYDELAQVVLHEPRLIGDWLQDHGGQEGWEELIRSDAPPCPWCGLQTCSTPNECAREDAKWQAEQQDCEPYTSDMIPF